MRKKISLMNDVFFKYYSQKEQILFIKTKSEHNYVLSLTSLKYIHSLKDLFARKITLKTFQAGLTEKGIFEFERLCIILQRMELIVSDMAVEPIQLNQMKYWTMLFNGEHFALQFESILDEEFEVHAQVHEGGACSPVGATATGSYDTCMYECAYDNSWANLGIGCGS